MPVGVGLHEVPRDAGHRQQVRQVRAVQPGLLVSRATQGDANQGRAPIQQGDRGERTQARPPALHQGRAAPEEQGDQRRQRAALEGWQVGEPVRHCELTSRQNARSRSGGHQRAWRGVCSCRCPDDGPMSARKQSAKQQRPHRACTAAHIARVQCDIERPRSQAPYNFRSIERTVMAAAMKGFHSCNPMG